jgi:uncharacterized protein
MGRGPRVGLVILGLILVAVFLLLGPGLDLWTDAIWFRSVGYDGVFWTRIGAQVLLFVGALIVALVVLLGNVWVAGRFAPRGAGGGGIGGSFATFFERLNQAAEGRRNNGEESPFGAWQTRRPAGSRPVAFQPDDLPDLTPIAGIVLGVIAALLALGVAGSVASRWETILLWQHQVPFDPTGTGKVIDPVFGRDIGFYLFQLPILRLVQALVNGLLVASLFLAGARYVVAALRGGFELTTRIRVHLGILGGLVLLSIAIGYQLDKLELVYRTQDPGFVGVGYTDHAARFVALDTLTVIAGLAGALLLGGAFTRWTWPLPLIVAAWFGASFILGTLYPEAVQRFSVKPDEQAKEAPYIANNIAMTRLAYGLDAWQKTDYGGSGTLTQAQVNNESATFGNARLWDYRPLGDTLEQIQTIRQYYDFTDVDTDRYSIAGTLRQVMLSGRELVQDKAAGGSWVNLRVTFTHGIGLAMVPVNEATPEGQPKLFISNLPPASTDGAPPITRPQIYFGERSSSYVVTGARQAEFDYPVGGPAAGDAAASTTTSWTGTTGIKLDTLLSRLLFAARFKDLDLLISDQVTSASQLLFHRSLSDRLGLVAPFLRYDKDPYLVVTGDGRLVYIQDAYTVSDRFPNAQPFDPQALGQDSGLAGDPINYIRNSVKIVMDAYDGTMTFYVADPSDPIIRAYQGVFPTLFKPIADLPADLRPHLRVPEELFNVQTRTYATYHVTDPVTLFQKSDVWAVPTFTAAGSTLAEEAYYVVMRMPGEQDPEFLLLQPMVPSGKQNMIAWVAARNDPANYGQVRVFDFPRGSLVFGPGQIQSRIDQDSTISAQVTLWDQAGSTVVRGNLIVVPVQDSLLYLEPIYLPSSTSKFPEFKKIVVASSSRVVWGDTLADALRLLLGGSGTTPPGGSPAPGSSPAPSPSPAPSGPVASPPSGDVAALIQYANLHFERAQTALRNGDFATYGSEIKLVQDALRQLDVLTSSPAP